MEKRSWRRRGNRGRRRLGRSRGKDEEEGKKETSSRAWCGVPMEGMLKEGEGSMLSILRRVLETNPNSGYQKSNLGNGQIL